MDNIYKDNSPFLSVVIPCYNGYGKMKKCLEMLEIQSFKNFEVIIIDDCSTDNSYEELQNYIITSELNVTLLKNRNNIGPGGTRNAGVEVAVGEYITFVDSDDYISKDAFLKIKNVIKKYKSIDCIIYDYYKVKDNRLIYGNTVLAKSEGILDTEFAIACSSGSTWGKVYRRELIIKEKIQFPNLIRGEDLVFNKTALSFCEKIYYLKEPLYYYVIHNDSIMTNSNTISIQNNIEAYKNIKKYLNSAYSNELEMIYIREYLYLIVQIQIINGKNNLYIKKFLSEEIGKNKVIFKNEYIKYQPLYMRICLFCIKYRILIILRLIFYNRKRSFKRQ